MVGVSTTSAAMEEEFLERREGGWLDYAVLECF